MSVEITVEGQTVVEIDGSGDSIEILTSVSEVEITDIGVAGPSGPSETSTWMGVAGDVEYSGTETSIASGDVLECDYKGSVIYRFINSTNKTNGYPLEDSFYADFNGTYLTNLIVTRGQ